MENNFKFEDNDAAIPAPFNPSPLNMERKESLKIFAILSVRNDLNEKDLRDKLGLTLIASYTLNEAVLASNKALEITGKDAKRFKTPFMFVTIPAAAFIEMKRAIMEIPREMLERILQTSPILMPAREPRLELKKDVEKKEKITKGKAELSAHVRYVFNAVGTPEEIIMAESVLHRFKTEKVGVDK